MAYDAPFRVTYSFSSNANAALAGLIPVPKGVNRVKVRHISQAAPTFVSAETATLTVNIGDGTTATKFATTGAQILDVANPVGSFDTGQNGQEIGDIDRLVVARAANGSVAKPVALTVVVDWY